MRRIVDRISVFALALLIDAARQRLFGAPPHPHRTWLSWAIERASARVPAPRLRALMPVLLAVVATRVGALLGRSSARGRGRWPLLLVQAALLASTFDVWRSLRAARQAERELAAAGDPAAMTGLVELELGELAQGASESVVGPWAAYAVADLPGAIAWAAAESIGGVAGGADGPLATVLESTGQLAAVQQARDAIAGGATLLAARGARGGGSLALHLDDIVDSAETPLAVTAMTVALDRRLVWNGRITGWQRPPPNRDDLKRATAIALRTLGVLAGATAAAIVVIELIRPSRQANAWRRDGPDWERLFDPRNQ